MSSCLMFGKCNRGWSDAYIATSIDAMVAGFTLNLIPVNPYVSCAVIAVVTGIFSFIGVFMGKQSGTWLESKAEIFGGLVLIGIGIKMVL